jgi:hypothetical protein
MARYTTGDGPNEQLDGQPVITRADEGRLVVDDLDPAVLRLAHAWSGRDQQMGIAIGVHIDDSLRHAVADQFSSDDAGTAFRQALVVGRRATGIGVPGHIDSGVLRAGGIACGVSHEPGTARGQVGLIPVEEYHKGLGTDFRNRHRRGLDWCRGGAKLITQADQDTVVEVVRANRGEARAAVGSVAGETHEPLLGSHGETRHAGNRDGGAEDRLIGEGAGGTARRFD